MKGTGGSSVRNRNTPTIEYDIIIGLRQNLLLVELFSLISCIILIKNINFHEQYYLVLLLSLVSPPGLLVMQSSSQQSDDVQQQVLLLVIIILFLPRLISSTFVKIKTLVYVSSIKTTSTSRIDCVRVKPDLLTSCATFNGIFFCTNAK